MKMFYESDNESPLLTQLAQSIGGLGLSIDEFRRKEEGAWRFVLLYDNKEKLDYVDVPDIPFDGHASMKARRQAVESMVKKHKRTNAQPKSIKAIAEFDSLKNWTVSGLCTATRTRGQILFNKNGTGLDIWIRVNGKPAWCSVYRQDLIDFLNSDDKWRVLDAESDGNAEGLK